MGANNLAYLFGLSTFAYYNESKISKQDITLTGTESGDQLIFTFEYCKKLFKLETIEGFINYFKKIVFTVIENPGIKLKDIDLVPGDKTNRIRSEIKKAKETVYAEFDI